MLFYALVERFTLPLFIAPVALKAPSRMNPMEE